MVIRLKLLGILMVSLMGAGAVAQVVNLPSSKQLVADVPGSPQRLNSLPMSMVVSADGRYVVTVNAGYGTIASGEMQSLAVMDTRTGVVVDQPEPRTFMRAKQTFYSGMAFSMDGRHLFVSLASLTDPVGDAVPGLKGKTGSGVAVYGFAGGKLTWERMIAIPLQKLAAGRKTKLIGGADADLGVPFSAGLALVPMATGEGLLIADDLSDDVLLVDAASGKVLTRFDVSENDAVPSVYPVDVVVAKDGSRAFVALWNGSEVVELDLKRGLVGRKLALLKPSGATTPGSHPCALKLSPDARTMFVALSNRDAVAAVDVSGSNFTLRGYFDARLPGQTYFGAQPESVAVSANGERIFVANAGSNAVAVFDTRELNRGKGMVMAHGFIPTDWMPTVVALNNGKLFVATAKGRGTGPNNFAEKAQPGIDRTLRPFAYIPTLLYGSLAEIDVAGIEKELPRWTEEVITANRMRAAQESIAFAGGAKGRIKHVIYILKENRTYDQIFGDLKQSGKPVGNGDARLTMYGEEVTPNLHKLALQFGVMDNFYDSAEVSAGGHVWSEAAITSDYVEKGWQQNYRGRQRGYDFESVVSEGLPMLQGIPDIAEPAGGYIWANAAAHGKNIYQFGEYVPTYFCNLKKKRDDRDGPIFDGVFCEHPEIATGEKIPEEWGGGVNNWPWGIPRMVKDVAGKPELVGHAALDYPDFNLRVPDQIRVNIFLRYFDKWVAEGGLPEFVMIDLPNDHTEGTRAGGPTPKASVADNDLAVGRLVEAVSHSKYWEDTAIFVVEDDAQNGGDHVDAHRSIALAISKYAASGVGGGAAVNSKFYTTVSMIRTMESLLGLPPMNNNDAFAPLMGVEFSGDGAQKAFVADVRNRENGLIYMANAKAAPGARASAKMDFRQPDRADEGALNMILWRDAMGDVPPPPMMKRKLKAKKDND